MSITVSVPAKIHLLGEHAVVYGRPALLAAIDKRLYVRIQKSEFRIQNNKKEKIIINTQGKDNLIQQAIDIFKKAFSITELPPLEITITSQIPKGRGLGSSAALSAATIGALMKFIMNLWDPNRINELAFKVEKIAHGNPSGADNSTVVFGGLVWFRREFDFLKSIWRLPVSSYQIPKFLLIDTGRPVESTREMVASVAKLYSRKKKVIEETFNDQEKQTKRLLLALRTGNKKELTLAIQKGEKNLEKLEVVGSLAQKLVREIENIGGAAKVCGGGGRKKGSGTLLCYHQDPVKIKKIGSKYHLPVSPVKLGEEGIRIEKWDK